MLMMIYKREIKSTLLEQIFSYANLQSIQEQLKSFYSNPVACVSMEVRCGVHTVLINLLSPCRVSSCFLVMIEDTA